MKSLQGKVAVLTGASRGLGVPMARALAERGVNLVLAARSAEALSDVRRAVERIGVQAVTVPIDLTLKEAPEVLIGRAEASFGRVDILINNAGLFNTSDYAKLDPDLVDEIIQVNLSTPMQLTRRVLPGMIARGEGHIVNVSSVGGLGASPYTEAYCATKHGLVGFTRSLRLTMQAEGHPIGVSALCPGFVADAGMFQDSMRATGASMPARFGSASAAKVASAMIAAIVRNDPEVVINSRPVRPLVLLLTMFPGLSERVAAATGIAEVCRSMARGRSLPAPSEAK